MNGTLSTLDSGPTWGFTLHHGDRLRTARDRRGLSQDQLSEISAVSRSSIANYEAGKPMRRLQGRALAMALGVSYEWLTTGAEAPDGDDDGLVRPEGFEPPTFWFGASPMLTCIDGGLGDVDSADEQGCEAA